MECSFHEGIGWWARGQGKTRNEGSRGQNSGGLDLKPLPSYDCFRKFFSETMAEDSHLMVRGLFWQRRKADSSKWNVPLQPPRRATMASVTPDPEDPGDARRRLIQLFDGGDYLITQRAQREGYPILRDLGRRSCDGALIEYVLHLLRGGHRIRRMIRGDPPDSQPRGWCIRNCDGNGLFIEMTIEEVRMGQAVACLISFHR